MALHILGFHHVGGDIFQIEIQRGQIEQAEQSRSLAGYPGDGFRLKRMDGEKQSSPESLVRTSRQVSEYQKREKGTTQMNQKRGGVEKRRIEPEKGKLDLEKKDGQGRIKVKEWLEKNAPDISPVSRGDHGILKDDRWVIQKNESVLQYRVEANSGQKNREKMACPFQVTAILGGDSPSPGKTPGITG